MTFHQNRSVSQYIEVNPDYLNDTLDLDFASPYAFCLLDIDDDNATAEELLREVQSSYCSASSKFAWKHIEGSI